jgi:hypothetical protein
MIFSSLRAPAAFRNYFCGGVVVVVVVDCVSEAGGVVVVVVVCSFDFVLW